MLGSLEVRAFGTVDIFDIVLYFEGYFGIFDILNMLNTILFESRLILLVWYFEASRCLLSSAGWSATRSGSMRFGSQMIWVKASR